MPTTPVTPIGLRRYDGYPAIDAVIMAWSLTGPDAAWHQAMKSEVRKAMPLLARALDRVSQEHPHGPVRKWAADLDNRPGQLKFVWFGANFQCPNMDHEDYDMRNGDMISFIAYIVQHFDCEELPNGRING